MRCLSVDNYDVGHNEEIENAYPKFDQANYIAGKCKSIIKFHIDTDKESSGSSKSFTQYTQTPPGLPNYSYSQQAHTGNTHTGSAS